MQASSQIPPRNNLGFYATENKYLSYVCYVPAGFDVQKALEPAFWAHLGYMLRTDDLITLLPDDRSWEASVRVIEAGPLWARVALRERIELKVLEADSSMLTIEWAGPHAKFRVLRGKDVLKDGFAKKADAQHWIDTEYLAKAA